jgi:dihydrofolate reductase
MAKLVYLTNASLDGYIEDRSGAIDLYEPDDEVFAATTELLRPHGTLLYGRRLYESMAVWETNPAIAEQSELTAEFARVWRVPEKVVFSRTLTAAPTAATRIERDFDPATVQDLKDGATADLLIGGAQLAARAFAEGLIDEYLVMLWPAIIGGGKPALPSGDRIDLELLDERRFANGVVFLRFRVASARAAP